MANKLVRSLTGACLAGLALTGCQNGPRSGAMQSGLPASRTATAQDAKGWDQRTPATPPGNGGAAAAGLANQSALPAAPAGALDPNALPRTSQDAMPRSVGNQISSYTTVPSRPAGADLAPSAAGNMRGPAAAPGPDAASGVTPTGLTIPSARNPAPAAVEMSHVPSPPTGNVPPAMDRVSSAPRPEGPSPMPDPVAPPNPPAPLAANVAGLPTVPPIPPAPRTVSPPPSSPALGNYADPYPPPPSAMPGNPASTSRAPAQP